MTAFPVETEFRWPRGGGATLVGVLLLAVAMRLPPISESLWLDELHTAWVVSDGIAQAPERAAIGNQSPLYFLMTWGATTVFGMHEWSLRGPSLVAGLALVAGAFLVALRWTNSLLAAGVVGLCAAIDRNFVFYATEARPYALVQLLALAQLYLYWRLETRPARWYRNAFIVTSVGMLYVHYTAALLLLGEVLFHFLCCWRRRHVPAQQAVYTLRKFVVDLGLIALCLLPSLPHVARIGERRMDWSAFVFDTNPLWVPYWFSLPSYVVLPMVVVALAWMTGQLGCSSVSCESHRRDLRTAVSLIATWFTVPVLTVWLTTLLGIAPLFLLRYVVGVAVAPMLFAGLGIGIFPSRRSQTLLAFGVIFAALISSDAVELWQEGPSVVGRRQDWRSAVAWINGHNDAHAPVFVRGGFLEADGLTQDRQPLLRDYCLAPANSIYRVDVPASRLVPLPNRQAWKLPPAALSLLTEHGSAWFLDAGSSASRELLRRKVLQTLAAAGHESEVLAIRDFGDVSAWQLQVSSQPAAAETK